MGCDIVPVSQGLSSDLARVVITDGHRSHKAEQSHCLQQRACVDIRRARWTLISWEELALTLVPQQDMVALPPGLQNMIALKA